MGGPLTGEAGDSPSADEFRQLLTKKTSDVPLRYSKGNQRQKGWIKETDKIALTNCKHNLNLKYLGVKSNYVKIRQEHKVVDFEICEARDDDKV